jgi:dolichol-phosphate mannosyltransferase
MDKLFIGLPAFNESLAIPSLFQKIASLRSELGPTIANVTIILNDDGSTDETVKNAIAFSKSFDLNLELILNPNNNGLATGLRNILDKFIALGSENSNLVLMDCDDTHNPIQILELISRLESSATDIVIASRYLRNSSIKGVPYLRIFTATIARAYLQLLFPKNGVTDFTCGYRIYRYSAIKLLKEAKSIYFKSNGFSCMPEILLRSFRLGLNASEIPIQLRYDLKASPSSMRILKNSWEIIILGIKARIGKFS